MAASIKCQWFVAKYAKFVYGEDVEDMDKDSIAETLDVPCKGKWKVYLGKDNELLLCYLESDHLLITHKNIILESLSLINSKTWLKGVAKKDSLMILNKLKDGNNRRFRIQFEKSKDNDGYINRKQCTELLRKHFPICDYDSQSDNSSNYGEVTNINQMMFDKLQYRKAYAIDVPKECLKEMIMLCLTDTTFPSYVAEVDAVLKNIGK